MAISFKNRTFDEEGRKILKEICVGNGIDIGSADRPISDNAKTLDINPDYNPDYLCDMHNIPIKDNSLDFIVASHVLEHTNNTIGVLKEWRRILKVGGKIGISVPDGECCDYRDLGDSMMCHKTLFTLTTLKLFLGHVGFEILQLKKVKLKNTNKSEIIAIAKK